MNKYLLAIVAAGLALQTHAAESNLVNIQLADNFSVISGNGGNILVFDGSRDVLIDSGHAENSAALLAHLNSKNITVDYLINSHWHSDHSGGNLALAKATIIAHDNLRKRLSARQQVKFFNVTSEPQPDAAKPTITYQSETNLFIDKQTFNIVHYAESHTDTDSVIYIQPANIAVLGDLVFSGSFPFIDVNSKGNINNLITTLESVANRIDDNTVIIPGHGALSNKAKLQATIAMLKTSRDTVKACKDQGKTLADCTAAGLPEELVSSWGSNGPINGDAWIGIVYETLY